MSQMLNFLIVDDFKIKLDTEVKPDDVLAITAKYQQNVALTANDFKGVSLLNEEDLGVLQQVDLERLLEGTPFGYIISQTDTPLIAIYSRVQDVHQFNLTLETLSAS